MNYQLLLEIILAIVIPVFALSYGWMVSSVRELKQEIAELKKTR